jgi:hypothetical protein
MRCRDVKEAKLIGALTVVISRDFDRITRVAQIEKFHAFNDTPGVDVQTGDNSLGQHD